MRCYSQVRTFCLTMVSSENKDMSPTATTAKNQTLLTITAKGQVTLRKDILQHLGVQPGDKIEVDLLPQGRIQVRPARRKRDIREFFGSLKQENGPHLTIEEMNEVIARGWAGKR